MSQPLVQSFPFNIRCHHNYIKEKCDHHKQTKGKVTHPVMAIFAPDHHEGREREDDHPVEKVVSKVEDDEDIRGVNLS